MRMTGRGTRFGIGLILVGTFLYIGTFSFVFAMQEDHGSGCEIALGGTSLCLMSYGDMSALTSRLAQGQPVLDLVSLLFVAPVLAAALLFLRPPRKKHRLPALLRLAPIPLYTLLFSRGILNPKAP